MLNFIMENRLLIYWVCLAILSVVPIMLIVKGRQVKRLSETLAEKEKAEEADSKKLAAYVVSKWNEIRKLEEFIAKCKDSLSSEERSALQTCVDISEMIDAMEAAQ